MRSAGPVAESRGSRARAGRSGQPGIVVERGSVRAPARSWAGRPRRTSRGSCSSWSKTRPQTVPVGLDHLEAAHDGLAPDLCRSGSRPAASANPSRRNSSQPLAWTKNRGLFAPTVRITFLARAQTTAPRTADRRPREGADREARRELCRAAMAVSWRWAAQPLALGVPGAERSSAPLFSSAQSWPYCDRWSSRTPCLRDHAASSPTYRSYARGGRPHAGRCRCRRARGPCGHRYR